MIQKLAAQAAKVRERSSWLLTKLGMNRIFAKVLVISLLILTVTFLIYTLISGTLLKREVTERQKQREYEDMSRMITLLETAQREGWTDVTTQRGLRLILPPQMKTVLIIDRQGRYVQMGGVPLPDGEIRDIVNAAGIGSAESLQSTTVEKDSRKWMVTSQYAASIDRYVVSLSGGLQNELRRMQSLNWLSIAIALAVSVIFSWMFSRYMTIRIQRMSQGAERIAKGRFDTQISDPSADELGQLAVSLNRMASELEALEGMRRDFLANVSHDLRSPLTSIHGYVEAILDGTVPRERADHYLRITQDQTVRLIKLVNDLLDMTKIESGQFDVQPTEFDLAEMIRQLLARMESTFQHHQVRYEINGAAGGGTPRNRGAGFQQQPDEGWELRMPEAFAEPEGAAEERDADADAARAAQVRVIGDPYRLEQVMINLLQNAMAFSPRQSTIYVTLDCRKDDVAVSIRDEGIGMKEEQQQLIWDRFYKSDEARGARGGTGIGLSIVKHILDEHGSLIEVESKPGRGSVFRFSLKKARSGEKDKL
ncbi:HAMP domain-containing histidine kinase [Paenibacillus pasadenensis]|uniref:sensor histidine kinase n=1 Tax=Paenibacillus pasadenensis TaxID=217090 RepID=UPI00204205D6|nr:ATP-binding protein [Paenibacillus pasadenensis]MCM3747583.1 HAMP domain-containing histidine kinase [Paenibacillus pasadenensis]